jgi:hypothetical protein
MNPSMDVPANAGARVGQGGEGGATMDVSLGSDGEMALGGLAVALGRGAWGSAPTPRRAAAISVAVLATAAVLGMLVGASIF